MMQNDLLQAKTAIGLFLVRTLANLCSRFLLSLFFLEFVCFFHVIFTLPLFLPYDLYSAPTCDTYACQMPNNILLQNASTTSCESWTCSDGVCCQAGAEHFSFHRKPCHVSCVFFFVFFASGAMLYFFCSKHSIAHCRCSRQVGDPETIQRNKQAEWYAMSSRLNARN